LRERPPKLKNAVVAFAIAPLGGAALLTVITLISGRWRIPTPPGASVADFAQLALMMATRWSSLYRGGFLTASVFCYLVSIILGIPGYLLFRRWRWVRRVHWVLLFAVIGSAPGAVIVPLATSVGLLHLNGKIEVTDFIAVSIFGALAVVGLLAGTVSGLIFAWIIKVKPPNGEDVGSIF
jgi:hypothetical protein